MIGSMKEGWNPVRLPSFSSQPTSSVFVQAIPLTLIGSMEAFSIARKYALQYKYEIDINQEAMALGMFLLLLAILRRVLNPHPTLFPSRPPGLANLLSNPLSTYPASGNFGRTALAADVGVRTPLANVAVGIVISVVLTRLTQVGKSEGGKENCSCTRPIRLYPYRLFSFTLTTRFRFCTTSPRLAGRRYL